MTETFDNTREALIADYERRLAELEALKNKEFSDMQGKLQKEIEDLKEQLRQERENL
jgi:hypothetical protein